MLGRGQTALPESHTTDAPGLSLGDFSGGACLGAPAAQPPASPGGRVSLSESSPCHAAPAGGTHVLPPWRGPWCLPQSVEG